MVLDNYKYIDGIGLMVGVIGVGCVIGIWQSFKSFGKGKPSAPKNPCVVDACTTETAITLRWDEPENDGGSPITGYIIEMSKASTEKYRKVDEKLMNEMECVVANLTDGTWYTFRVAAKNAVGTSEYVTTEKVETIPSKVTELARKHTALSTHEITRLLESNKNLESANEKRRRIKDGILKNWTLPNNGPKGEKQALNIILLGKTGAGKSATGNIIVGDYRFEESHSSESCTKDIEKEECVIDDVPVTVIDTPSFDGMNMGYTKIFSEISKAEDRFREGIDALLFVFNIGNTRFTKDQQDAFKVLEKGSFSKDAKENCFVILTNIDSKRNVESLLKYIANEQNSPFGNLLNNTEGRVMGINNADQTIYGRQEQRGKILQLICDKKGNRFSPGYFKAF